MVMKVEKVISALPGTLDSDTVYLVRTGPGFELFVSDTTGTIAYEPNELGKSYFIESFEENGSINTTTNGGEHWAVGNGAELTGVTGIQIPLNCKLIGAASTANAGSFTVEIYRNEIATGFTVPTTSGGDNVTTPSGGSIDIQAGDRIKLRTTAVATATVGTVTLLFSTNETTFAGTSIGELSDVDLTGIADGDSLAWSTASGRFEPGAGGGGGTDVATVQAIASGSTLGLQQQLLADAGQPGKTVLAVGYTTNGKVQGVSLGAGNVVEVYANGTDFNSGTVLYREFMNFGEPICFTGLSNGAIITSTQGFYGFSDQVDGADISPMPLLSYGLAFDFTFFFGFRNSQTYNPGSTSADQGWVHVVNGPLDNTIKLTFGNGTTVQGQEDIDLAPWEYRRLYTDGNVEYILEGTAPMMACVNARMDTNPHGQFYDSRLIMPLTNDGITWPRSGFVSAPFNNTQVDFWVRDGAEGRLNSTAGTGVSPGSPVDFDAAIGVGTGASDQDYEPNGATRVKAIGLVSAYSGADSAGLEASPLMPTSAMSQIVAQPIFITDEGDGGNSGIAIASPYEGTARVFEYNTTTDQLDLAYTVPLTRTGVTVATQDDQNHPAAGGVMNDAVSGVVAQVGAINPGVIIADVPITVVVQSGSNTGQPTIRSQNGTTTSQISNNDDETLSLGITPTTIAAEIREDANGLLRRRAIDGSGVETWVLV